MSLLLVRFAFIHGTVVAATAADTMACSMREYLFILYYIFNFFIFLFFAFVFMRRCKHGISYKALHVVQIKALTYVNICVSVCLHVLATRMVPQRGKQTIELDVIISAGNFYYQFKIHLFTTNILTFFKKPQATWLGRKLNCGIATKKKINLNIY